MNLEVAYSWEEIKSWDFEAFLDKAREMGLEIEFHKTCCSKSY